MEQQFIELLKEVNIAQIFIIFAGGWVFYNRLDKKISNVATGMKEMEKGLKNDMKEIEKGLTSKIDKLGEKVEDIDRRLCRIEGGISFAHFASHQARMQKVESRDEES